MNNRSTWNIPSDAVTALSAAGSAYITIDNAASSPDASKSARTRRREEYKTFTARIRDFENKYIRYNDLIDDAACDMLGVPRKTRTRSPVPVPATVPELSVDTGTVRVIKVHYRDQNSSRRGKPAKVHGIEIRWAILDRPPGDLSELTNSGFDTRPPFVLEFGEHQRGLHVYLAGRWEIQREGEKGHFGDIVNAIIP
ncbi:MAG: hypothetical protein LBQ67_00080 [Treponema sp.]|nr:hypothetical protein [Treponema sp.]